MRKLIDGTNVDAATGDYPKGRVRNKVGGTPGTIYNEELHGDIMQFFQKLVIDGPVAENDLPDNVTNGYQLIDALVAKIEARVDSLNGGLRTTVVDIGDWDMTTLALKNVAHGLTLSKIRSYTAIIRTDADDTYYPFEAYNGEANFSAASSTLISLNRFGTGHFDNASFSTTSYNRGWVVIKHIP
jgi:hypothetical protein